MNKKTKEEDMEKHGYSPITIANFFVRLYQDKEGLSLLKLIKLCYISHGFNLAANKRPLIAEQAQAWEYGPVFPSVYHAFKFSFRPIRQMVYCEKEIINEKEKKIMRLVNTKYGCLTGVQLSALTHAKDTPWKKTKQENKSIIDNEEIKEYYKSLPQREQDD